MAIGRPHDNPDVPGPTLRIFSDVLSSGGVCVVTAKRGARAVGRLTAERVDIEDLSAPCRRSLHEAAVARGMTLVPWAVVHVDVEWGERNQGVGLDLYIGAARALAPTSGAIVAMTCTEGNGWTSSDAMRVWKSSRMRDHLHVHGNARAGFVGTLRTQSGNPDLRAGVLAW